MVLVIIHYQGHANKVVEKNQVTETVKKDIQLPRTLRDRLYLDSSRNILLYLIT